MNVADNVNSKREAKRICMKKNGGYEEEMLELIREVKRRD
jgi:hypothetical protein